MTTQNLEDVIRDIIARGEMTHLSLTPSQNGALWRASFSPAKNFGNSFAEDKDPIAALMRAMTSAKLARKAPTDRDLAAMDAKATGKIEQPTIDADDGKVDQPPPGDPHADLM